MPQIADTLFARYRLRHRNAPDAEFDALDRAPPVVMKKQRVAKWLAVAGWLVTGILGSARAIYLYQTFINSGSS